VGIMQSLRPGQNQRRRRKVPSLCRAESWDSVSAHP